MTAPNKFVTRLRLFWASLPERWHSFIFAIFIGFLFALFLWHRNTPPNFSLAEAKRALEDNVVHDHRTTLYCEAPFDEDKLIIQEGWFPKDTRMSWEHAVPVSEFGSNFPEWTKGHRDCVARGKPYRGRKCAEKTNPLFQQMQADMYNLFPAVASVNAIRSNREYTELTDESPANLCGYKTARGKFEPPPHARGQVARAALYMEAQYKNFSLKPKQKLLFQRWNEEYPVTKWECTRARRIEKIQKNENLLVKIPCKKLGLW